MDLGWLYHGLGGAGINGLFVVAPLAVYQTQAAEAWGTAALPFAWAIPFLMPPLLFAGGYLRERWQHMDDSEPMNRHRWWEAAAWGIGGLVAAGLGLVWLG